MSGRPSGPGVPPAGRRRRALAVAVVTAAALAALTGAGPPPSPNAPAARRVAYPDTFPAGSGRAIAERACLICHSAMLVTQQAKDSTGWEKSLATMKTWGAPMSNTDKDTLRDYLRARFGPRAPAAR